MFYDPYVTNTAEFTALIEESTHETASEADLECVRADQRVIPAHVSVKMLTSYFGFARREKKGLSCKTIQTNKEKKHFRWGNY